MWLLFFLILVILQSVMLMQAKRIKKRYYWKKLFKIEVLSISLFIIFVIFYKCLNNYMVLSEGSFKRSLIFIFCYWLGYFNVLLLFTSIILYYKNEYQISEDDIKSKINLIYIFIVPIFLIILFFDSKPILSERFKAEKNIDSIINYLNSKYGNNNYKVGKIEDLSFCFLGCSESEYSYSIKSNILLTNFDVIYNYSTNEIVKDTFIYEWGKQNKWFEKNEDFHNWTKNNLNMKYNKQTNEYTLNFLYEPNLNYTFNKELTVDEYLNSLNLIISTVEINRDFSSEDEFLEFIINIYNECKKYTPDMDELNFKFKDLNPFYTNELNNRYKTSGFVKENNSEYLVFYKSDPRIIKK